MLWGIALIFIFLWLLGLATGFTMGSFIHIFQGNHLQKEERHDQLRFHQGVGYPLWDSR
ncbi:MAG: DUF5670 family protein [Syntrophales bacterium]